MLAWPETTRHRLAHPVDTAGLLTEPAPIASVSRAGTARRVRIWPGRHSLGPGSALPMRHSQTARNRSNGSIPWCLCYDISDFLKAKGRVDGGLEQSVIARAQGNSTQGRAQNGDAGLLGAHRLVELDLGHAPPQRVFFSISVSG